MRIAWLTDIHLNFVPALQRQLLYRSIRQADPEAILVGGDWAEAPSLNTVLAEWHSEISIPTHYVLGNHDFYQGNFRDTRAALPSLQNLNYLTTSQVISFTPDTALIGHDSWADARLGDFFSSPVQLNDYRLIADLSGLNSQALYDKLNHLGDTAANFLEAQLRLALATHDHVLLLTHVPPFREACWHEGQISSDHFLPHFACRAVGERLKTVMLEFTHRTLRVLCGHTHSAGTAQILPNLTVYTGQATYGQPAIVQIIEV